MQDAPAHDALIFDDDLRELFVLPAGIEAPDAPHGVQTRRLRNGRTACAHCGHGTRSAAAVVALAPRAAAHADARLVGARFCTAECALGAASLSARFATTSAAYRALRAEVRAAVGYAVMPAYPRHIDGIAVLETLDDHAGMLATARRNLSAEDRDTALCLDAQSFGAGDDYGSSDDDDAGDDDGDTEMRDSARRRQ